MLDRLLDALNATPGITAELNPYIEDPGRWVVMLEPDRDESDRPTVEAWVSLMLLAYGARSWMHDVRLQVDASPPMLNPIPDIWTLGGSDDPDKAASIVDQLNLIPYDEWNLDGMLADESDPQRKKEHDGKPSAHD